MTGLLLRQTHLLRHRANTKALNLTHKRNINVFLNNNNKNDQPLTTNTDTSKVTRSLSNIFQTTQPPAPADPHFSVIDSGYGSLIMAKMPPHSMFYTRVGQTLGQSPRARSRAITKGPTAILRPLLGRQTFVQEISTQDISADVLLAPKQQGDVVVVGLTGSVDYYVRKSCLLATTKFLNISTWKAIGAEFNALAFDKVEGKGSMVINSYGGLHRLVLQENEEYLVDPRYVVAWSSNLQAGPQSGQPKPFVVASNKHTGPSASASASAATSSVAAGSQIAPLMSNAPILENKISWPAPSPTKPTQTVNESTTSDAKNKSGGNSNAKPNVFSALSARILLAVKNSTRTVLYASANAIRTSGWAAAKTTRTLAGVPDLYRVIGPGEIFVSTRLTPKPWTRIANVISAKSSATE
ncbi:hypothetical protein H4R99_004762 [Coemansia sp. RSA 1722]|nr:hypothetical protein LPJ57_004430 [Coemansia sp. RSA 486]KAJ2237055.1 hypothetical protein IWW45_001282 [Coemansia sp. RSA 485]KAJ2596815.1 hypothetical protein H4R99_004762 [Coemansia sp. RSA 1722]